MTPVPHPIDPDYCVCGHLMRLHDELGCNYECVEEEGTYGKFPEDDDIPVLT